MRKKYIVCMAGISMLFTILILICIGTGHQILADVVVLIFGISGVIVAVVYSSRVEKVIQRLESDVTEMKTVQYRYRQTLKSETLQKLLSGDFDQEEIENNLKESGILWDKKICCVVRFSFHHPEFVKSIYSTTDLKLICLTMISELEEYLREKGYSAYGVEDVDHSVYLIMQLDEEYENSEEYARKNFPNENTTEIQQLLMGAKLQLEDKLQPIIFFVSVGRSVTEYGDIHRSWLDTSYANVYRFTRGPQRITLFTEHMENYESGIPYPLEIEKKLTSNIRAAQLEQAEQTLEGFFLAVQTMAPDEMKWAINQFMTSIFRLGMSNECRMKDGNPLDWKYWTNKLNDAETAEEMKEVMKQLLSSLSMDSGENISERKRVAAEIRRYIDCHFPESTITVTEIASRTGFSINYARQIFKEYYGISISDYILEKRIEMAKQLLTGTDHTGKQIAEMVGYVDHRYFYVVFKKKTGETADSYRKNNQ